MYPRTLKKHFTQNNVACVLLTLYMLNTFTLASLFVSYHPNHATSQRQISHIKGQSNWFAPNKAASRVLYYFMAQRKITKSEAVSYVLKKYAFFLRATKQNTAPKLIANNPNPCFFALSDAYYKRYRNLQVLLI